MPTLVVLATADTALAEAWQSQLPAAGPPCAWRRTPPGGTSPGFAAVIILDAAAEAPLPTGFLRCPTIFVGEPRSIPFEQARLPAGPRFTSPMRKARPACGLSAAGRGGRREAVDARSWSKSRKAPTARPDRARRRPRRMRPSCGTSWRGRWRTSIPATGLSPNSAAPPVHCSTLPMRSFSCAKPRFRADRGTSSFPADDPIVAFFENHPAVIDGTIWEGPAIPWPSWRCATGWPLGRPGLLVPVHDNGRLLGLIALGVRDDGEAGN